MADPLGRAETAALLDRHGIRLRKSLGQHFLVEPNVVHRIVSLAGVGPGSKVVEVGAGAGTLTRALAAAGAQVIAYEVDEALRPVLAETVGDAADIRFADAAAIDFTAELKGEGWTMVANLPYNVGTPIVLDVLRGVPSVVRMVVMLQKEAVQRLAAPPGTKAYGLPSVTVALHASVRKAFEVGSHLFVPRPRVESAVAVMDRSPSDPRSEEAIAIAAIAFSQRRKMLRSSLRDVVPADRFNTAGIDPRSRAGDVTPTDYLRLVGP